MDDKENTMREEEKKKTAADDNAITDFDDLHKEDNSRKAEENTKKESPKEEQSIKEDSSEKVKKEDSVKEDTKKEETKEEDSTKEDTKKEEAKKEDSAKEDTKKEETKKEDSAKEDTKKEDSVKEDTKKEKTKKEDSSKEDTKKEEAKKEDSSKEDSKEKDEKKVEVSNNAVSQSKRLAEAKAAAEAAKKENGDSDMKSVKEPKSKKALWITLASLAGVLMVAYLAGFIYFSGHFYQDVAINGIAVSGMDKTTAKQTLDQFYTDYKLTLQTIDDKDIVIDGKDISMQISLHDDFSSCLKQQTAYIWFINMFEHHDYEVGADASWDEAALSEILEGLKILDKKTMVKPKDAYVGVEDGKFTIVKEVLGSTLKIDVFEKAVNDSLSAVLPTLVMLDAGCYELPQVYETDINLQKELDAKNEYAKNEIKLQLDDFTLEPGMELYEAVLEKKGDEYEISESLVKNYVQSLAKEYDTLGTERTFTTSFNNRKATAEGDAFGYEMNQEDTEKALYKALTSGKPATVDVVFDSKGYTLQGENDIGDTYIEVNLSEQKVFAYKNGKKIAEGDCVSGKESTGNGTCIGLYAIQDKLSPTVLRGEKKAVTKTITKKNKNGKKVKVEKTTYEYEYESPVTFWMQFNGGIGLHDAAGWRSQYGGSIYYYSGSHGCVNLPYDLAETLYNNFEVGDPVIVYFWDNENRK